MQGCHFKLCQWKLDLAILAFSTLNNLKFSKQKILDNPEQAKSTLKILTFKATRKKQNA